MNDNLTRAERRRLKRARGKLKKTEARKKAKSLDFILVFILIAVSLGIVYWAINRQPDPETNEVKVASMGENHIGSTEGIEYNSNPPTSGPHLSEWQRDWKFYDSEVPTGALLHNMEHGGVVVYYKPDISQETKDLLKKFTKNNFKVITSANSDIPVPIAMAAWGVYEYFDDFDKAAMKAFAKRNRNTSSENVYP